MKFKKHEHGKEKKDRESEVKRDKDVRAPHQREWSNTRRYNVLTSVLCVQEETGQTIGLSHILPLKTSNNLKEIIGKEHTYCKVDSTVQDRERTGEPGELDEKLTEALLRKRICVYDNEELTVNRCHQYFYQVQHQMYVAGRYWNDFVVKGSLSTELFIKRVQFDPTFWGPVLLN